MKKPLLEAKGLQKAYPLKHGTEKTGQKIRAVDQVDLTIAPGEIVGLAGESGCGKSTLARILACLETRDQGEIYFADCPIHNLSERALRAFRPLFQPIFQDPLSSLNPRFTVRETLEEALALPSASQAPESLAASLAQVGLGAELLRRYPHQLSGGQRQRICIARAMAVQPRLLLADEPLSSLDVSIQAQIVNLFLDLQERLNLSILFISHDLRVVGHLSDRILIMYAGRIVESAPTKQLFKQPRHPYTQMLFRALPRLSPHQMIDIAHREAETTRAAGEQGCCYYPRCEYRQPECLAFANELLDTGEGQRAACRRWPAIPPLAT
jgi:peptide/nickel transport system ATP-binding protein